MDEEKKVRFRWIKSIFGWFRRMVCGIIPRKSTQNTEFNDEWGDITADVKSKGNLRRFCYAVATLGSLGEWPFGGLIASTLAIPLIFLCRSVYWLSDKMFFWMIPASLILLVVIVQIALSENPEKARGAVVWDKIIGVMIALVGISLQWRVVIFGFILFHILNIPQVGFFNPFGWYRKIIWYIEKLPGVLGVFGAELLSGVLINMFLHLIVWVMKAS